MSGLARDRGVLHPTAVWRAPSGALVTLRVGPGAPTSATDGLLLGLARARADAILTTGRNLRAEPTLSHALDPRLAAWRRDVVGRREPPRSVVLTSGRALPFEHPVFHGPSRAWVVTSRDGAARVARAAARAGVEVIARERPGARDALDFLQRQRGCETVCVEAGPSTTRALYDEPAAVDELLLSVYEEPTLPERARGGDLFALARIEALFGPPRREVVRLEPSGRWRFLRYRRG